MGWTPAANWPIQKGDEILAAHFSDVRKLMFAIDYMDNTWIFNVDDYNEWKKDTEYEMYDVVKHRRPDGEWQLYKMRYGYSKGQSPPGNGWILIDRPNVYCDYARNAMTFDWADEYRSFLRYPPDVNKYTQSAVMDDNKYWWPLEQTPVWRVKKKPDDSIADWDEDRIEYNVDDIVDFQSKFWICIKAHTSRLAYYPKAGSVYWQEKPRYAYFWHPEAPLTKEELLPELPDDDEARRLYDLSSKERVLIDKKKEYPIEFVLCSWWHLQELISGPVGAQYVELHPPPGWIMWPPWYYPYYMFPTNPDEEHKYFDGKWGWGGYQSRCEHFVETEAKGKFYWYNDKVEDGDPCDSDAFVVLHDKCVDNALGSIWKCNQSAFEKCLSIIAGEKAKEVKATTKYDWYLDRYFPPDCKMKRLVDPSRLVKAVWRRTWRYTFKPPQKDVWFWPGEWGKPPFWDEDYNWWCSYANVRKAIDRTYQKFIASEENLQVALDLYYRHYPHFIKRGAERVDLSVEAEEDVRYMAKVEDLRYDYDKFTRLRVYMAKGFCYDPKRLSYYEMTANILNDMKEVLECLRYVKVSCNLDCREYRGNVPLSTITTVCFDDDWGDCVRVGADPCGQCNKVNWPMCRSRLQALQDFDWTSWNGCGQNFGLYAAIPQAWVGSPVAIVGVANEMSAREYKFWYPTGSPIEKWARYCRDYVKGMLVCASGNGVHGGGGGGAFQTVTYDTVCLGVINMSLCLSSIAMAEPWKGWCELPITGWNYNEGSDRYELIFTVSAQYQGWSIFGPPAKLKYPPSYQSFLAGQVDFGINITNGAVLDLDPYKVDLNCTPVERTE